MQMVIYKKIRMSFRVDKNPCSVFIFETDQGYL